MGEILSVILYLYIVYGLSFTLNLFIKYKASLYEQIAMRLGIGTAIFTILGVIMDLLFIPLSIWIYIIIATALYLVHFTINRTDISSKNFKDLLNIGSKKHTTYTILVFIMLIITMFMYIGGSMKYPYMENGDPWGYLGVSKMISDTGTFKAPYKYEQYSEPYSQGYQILMGVLHQANDDIMWTLKFFHNFFISFSIVFFFFMVRQLFKGRPDAEDIAFFGTLVLFSVPAWLSHFAFSLTFNFVLIIVLLYTLLKIDEDDKWKYIASLVFGSILVNHLFSAAITFIVIAVFYSVKMFCEKEFNKGIVEAIIYGILLSLTFFIPANLRHTEFFTDSTITGGHGGLDRTIFPLFEFLGQHIWIAIILLILIIVKVYMIYKPKIWFPTFKKHFLDKTNLVKGVFFGAWAIFLGLFFGYQGKIIHLYGTGDNTYNFVTFFKASSQNLINNPVGWGMLVTLLAIASFFILAYYLKDHKLFSKENFAILLTLSLFALFFLLIFGENNSIHIMPFRMWTIAALFMSIMVGAGIVKLLQIFSNPEARVFILVVVAVGILGTSFAPKFELNSMVWPEHEILDQRAYPLYIWMKDGGLPDGTNVINPCKNSFYLFAYDMSPITLDLNFSRDRSQTEHTLHYSDDVFERNINVSHQFYKDHGVEYVVLGGSCLRGDPNRVPLLQGLLGEIDKNRDKFELVRNTPSEFLFRII